MWLWFSVLLALFTIVGGVAGLLWPILWADKQPTERWYLSWWRYWHYICLPLLGWRHRQRLQRLIAQAGMQAQQVELVFVKQCTTAMMTCLLILLSGGWFGLAWVWVVFLAGGLSVIFYWYPVVILGRSIYHQQQQLQRDFPFMLDLLTLSIEAGMGVITGLQLCVLQLPPHVLRQQLQQTLDDLRTGTNRELAFTQFSERIAIDEGYAFVAALLQSFELGGSLGPLLRQQAEQRRQERFLRAEKKALEAPVKMLFPLVVCIFPCTFLVIGYPLVMQLGQQL